jgi:SNF2 family DNA or RNA helicase
LLTGTPIQNQLDEFYAMMDFSCPGLLGPLNRFNRIFSTPIQKSQDRLATEEDTGQWEYDLINQV